MSNESKCICINLACNLHRNKSHIEKVQAESLSKKLAVKEYISVLRWIYRTKSCIQSYCINGVLVTHPSLNVPTHSKPKDLSQMYSYLKCLRRDAEWNMSSNICC